MKKEKKTELVQIGNTIYDFIKSFEQRNIAAEVWIPQSSLSRLFGKNKSKNKVEFNKVSLTMFYRFLRKRKDMITELLDKIENYLYNN